MCVCDRNFEVVGVEILWRSIDFAFVGGELASWKVQLAVHVFHP